jgi:uncharacterized protein (TIGR02246 family)
MGLSTDDIVTIQGLAARYNHAVDSGDSEAFSAVFTEDGVLSAGELQVKGRDALGDFAKGFAGSVREPRHIAHNIVIEGDGDKATLKAYIQMFIMSGEPGQQVVATSGKYNDTLVKENGSWKFTERVFTADS